MGWRIPFKANGDYNQKKKSSDVGLQILINLSNGLEESSDYILLKSKPNFRRNLIPLTTHHLYSCFLKSCFLCNKTLSHDKDVYMYRGDQGFCSEECRSRQIYVDEIREIEISTKQMIESYRKSLSSSGGGGGRCEANILQEELRHRHNPLPRKPRAIFL